MVQATVTKLKRKYIKKKYLLYGPLIVNILNIQNEIKSNNRFTPREKKSNKWIDILENKKRFAKDCNNLNKIMSHITMFGQ